MYIIDYPKKNVWRLDPGTPEKERKNNPNKWKYDNRNLCLLPA
jgi:hypothetical protein